MSWPHYWRLVCVFWVNLLYISFDSSLTMPVISNNSQKKTVCICVLCFVSYLVHQAFITSIVKEIIRRKKPLNLGTNWAKIWNLVLLLIFIWPKIKGIVHPKMKMWCLSAYPQGIQDVGDFVSSIEHKRRFLTQTVAVCQSYNGSQWNPRLWESKKTYTDKTKLNPAARDDTWRFLHRPIASCLKTSMYRHEPQGLIWF